MSVLRVERFDGTPAEWDGFARGSAGWTHFHLWGWKPVLERTYGHECVYLAARASDRALRGILPLVRVRSRLFGHFLVSMPFLNYGGPLGGEDAVRALAGGAVRLAARDGVKLLELRNWDELPLDLQVSHRKITVVLDLLPGDPDGVFKRFPGKLRSQVRRPAKDGVTVRFGPDQVAPFFTVFSRHMRDLGTPAEPRTLFEAIAAQFGDDVWFGCAYLGGEPIAGAAGFRWGDQFEITRASALKAHSRLSPNMALYWAFIERAAREGLAVFNFGRCTPGSGTHRFKQQWGGRDVPLHWYHWTPGGGDAHTPSPDDGAFSWGPRIWRRLPVGLATALGPRLVRYIP